MLPLSITRNRRAEGQEKAHNNAVRRALERKAVREFIKANPDVLTDEEDLEEDKSGKGTVVQIASFGLRFVQNG